MQYQLILVVRPQSDSKAILDRLTAVITQAGFNVGESFNWGKKQLAYPLSKQTEGLYLEFLIDASSVTPHTLSANLKLDESILRHLVLKKASSRDQK